MDENDIPTSISIHCTKRQKKLFKEFLNVAGLHMSPIINMLMVRYMLETVDTLGDTLITSEIKREIVSAWRK